MICPHCNREDFISLARNRKLVEFRLLNTKGKSGSGEYVFRGKQWKKERDMIDSEYYLRCNACETKLDNSVSLKRFFSDKHFSPNFNCKLAIILTKLALPHLSPYPFIVP